MYNEGNDNVILDLVLLLKLALVLIMLKYQLLVLVVFVNTSGIITGAGIDVNKLLSQCTGFGIQIRIGIGNYNGADTSLDSVASIVLVQVTLIILVIFCILIASGAGNAEDTVTAKGMVREKVFVTVMVVKAILV